MGAFAVTGANRGVGLAAARRLAAGGHAVILLCRDRGRGNAALGTLAPPRGREPHRVVAADLASLASVRAAAEQVVAMDISLDGLVNNAAVIPRKRAESRDGFEMQLAVTHLAHFLLANLLLPMLRRAPGHCRVVTVSSGAHHGPPFDFDDPNFLRRPYRRLQAYQQSKLANVLFTLALARRAEGTGVQALALHPGVYDTGLFRDYMGRIPGAGAVAGVIARRADGAGPIVAELAAGHPQEDLNGAYFNKRVRTEPSAEALDREAQERLWEWSADAVGLVAGP